MGSPPTAIRKSTTLVAGLHMAGMVAPMVLDGPFNSDWFEIYALRVLGPKIRPGDMAIMYNNLSSQKRPSAQMLNIGARCIAALPAAPQPSLQSD